MLKEITSKEHPIVKHMAHLRQNRDYRHECKRVVIEGEKLVHDAVSKWPYCHLMVSDPLMVPEASDPGHISLVTPDIMKKITGMMNPPKMLAEVALPPESSLEGLNWVLALDRLQDPGNLGTLFRSALALGWQGVFLIGDTVDPFNDKALRAAQGASLFIPYRTGSLKDFNHFIATQQLPVYLADSGGEAPPKLTRGCLVVGREGEGLDPDLKEIYPSCGIPMHSDVESLNVAVAGGILLYSMRQV